MAVAVKADMRRVDALRLSLLVSMGLMPVACGATRLESNQEAGGSSGAGSSSKPSKPAKPGTGGGPAQSTTCTSPQPDEFLGGLVHCEEGYYHRPAAVACTPVFAEGPGGQSNGSDGGSPNDAAGGVGGVGGNSDALPEECDQDPSQCDVLPNGFCNSFTGGDQWEYWCESGCVTDGDCGVNHLCECGHPESPTGGVCRVANCRTDADCGGLLCASFEEGCGFGGYACLRKEDQCRSGADCENDDCGITGDIFIPTEAHRTCGLSVCGRPFLIEAQARVAPLRDSRQWGLENLLPQLDHLTEQERSEQAAHWARLGQMEHASIAAFARFSLQLLALGAPPELVEACTRALADETRHARLCFQLASTYAGHGVSPGPLDVEHSLAATELLDVVDLVIAEGCVGETSAALEALEAAEAATDPVISGVYSQIAEDEQRHAALAFRFLRWALAQADCDVRSRINAALRALASTAVARDVVAPCLQALLNDSQPGPEVAC